MQTKYYSLIKRAFQQSFICLLLTIFVGSCADSSNKKLNKITNNISAEAAEDNKNTLSASAYVEKAQASSPELAPELLLKASQQYLREGDSDKSLWLANKVGQLPLKVKQQYEVYLLKAKLLLLDQNEKAEEQLALADDLITEELNISSHNTDSNTLSHSSEYYRLSKQLFDLQGNPIAAAESALYEFSVLSEDDFITANTSDTENSVDFQSKTIELWTRLSLLSTWQLSALVNKQAPFIDGWNSLIRYAQTYGYQPSKFARYINQWQRKYAIHPAQGVIETLTLALTSEPIILNNIVVLVPLSGAQQTLGKIIQEGILAAYSHQSDQQVLFYDANTVDYAQLPALLLEKEIDYVIGPLLKENVATYLSQLDIHTPTLLLNVPEFEQQLIPEHIIALSMKPEDEAIQAATTLSQLQYQAPLVLAHNDATSKRIALAFAEQWEKVTSHTPEISYFDQDRSMQGQIKSSLDINYSQQRIQKLRSTIKPSFEIKSGRNRRDIDMIYAIGDPVQIKLLKPYVDVNVSPFANIIPIYANSKSHSADVNETTSRDLSGLIFAEMPWLLSSDQQNKPLAKTAKALWPNRSDSLQLFFALGYDSFNLIQALPRMKDSPYLRHFGQTGIFKLENNVLTRSLLWGQYINNKEKQVVLD